MNSNLTFGQKLAAGYFVTVAFAVAISITAVFALRSAVASKDRVIGVNAQILLDAEKLEADAEKRASALRGYLLTREDRFMEQLRSARSEFAATMGRLKSTVESDEAVRRLDAIERTSADHRQQVEELLALMRSQAKQELILRQFDDKLQPARERFVEAVRGLVVLEERRLADAKQAATDTANAAGAWLTALAATAVLLAMLLAVALTRTLGRQIGTAVGHVQSSSSELQAAATQQASGAKEQASAMNEITTTISELVATSRQIAESAQHVARIAEQTAGGARHGEAVMQRGQESMAAMRQQAEHVVDHMLGLGRKSQEIGAVVEIVSELAEQTNILAINATIEASGAGEAGKRFAVVADEIRKLADRVTNSAKEIRALIDDVRGSVNTTVMATESSAKAVDAGSRQFAEVAVAFKQIAGLVVTATDAAHEIELSTKQQATAAEQVRVAVSDVAQATHETEASTGQTLQTAAQLATLSTDLMRLIRPRMA